MLIRKARPEESEIIASYLLLAMEDIANRFIGQQSKDKAIAWLSSLVR